MRGFFTRGHGKADAAEVSPSAGKQARSSQQQTQPSQLAQQARPTRRPQTDIPIDVLDSAYVPPLTSSKASFRSDGADHQRDQEFSRGVADDRWNDEDRFTNKSGDPRIGTHGRTYEPEESRGTSRD
ncbi:MAG: hypothetical protein JO315_19065 [Acidobacteria bacterium]|nr:hypothetical protein [Acidobacteriota bacterium]